MPLLQSKKYMPAVFWELRAFLRILRQNQGKVVLAVFDRMCYNKLNYADTNRDKSAVSDFAIIIQ